MGEASRLATSFGSSPHSERVFFRVAFCDAYVVGWFARLVFFM